MNWLLYPFSSLLDAIAEWLLDGVMDLFNEVTKLKFNVLTMTVQNGVIPGISYIKVIVNGVAWALFGWFLYVNIMKLIIDSVDGSYRSSFMTLIKRFFVTAGLIIIIQPVMTFLFTNFDNILSLWLDYFDISETPSIDLSEGGLNVFWNVIFSAILAYNIFGAVLIQIERFVILYICYFLSPVAMAFYCTEDNNTATKDYMIAMVTQVVTILLNYFIFYCFRLKLESFNSIDGNFMLDWFIAIALLSVAKSSEDIMKVFGLHSLPSANTARDFFTGLAGSMTAYNMGKSALSTGSKLAGKAMAFSDPSLLRNTSPLNNLTSPLKGAKNASENANKHVKTFSQLGKEAQQKNYKSVYDPEKKEFMAVGSYNSKDMKQVANEIGATKKNPGRNIFEALSSNKENKVGLEQTSEGIRNAQKEMNQSLESMNKFMQDPTAKVSNKDASRAMMLEQSLPNFKADPNSEVRRLKNGDFAIDGVVTTKNADGSFSSRPVTMAFSTKDRNGKLSGNHLYSDKSVNVSADGNLKAYEVKGKSDAVDSFFLQRSSTGNSPHAFNTVATQQMIEPEKNMNGAKIASNSLMTDNGNLFFKTVEANKDGSLSENVMMATANDYTNGQMVDGFIVSSRRYNLGVDENTGTPLYAIEMRNPTTAQLNEYVQKDDYGEYNPMQDAHDDIMKTFEGKFNNQLTPEQYEHAEERLNEIFDKIQSKNDEQMRLQAEFENQDAIESGHGNPKETYENKKYDSNDGDDSLLDTSNTKTIKTADDDEF